MAKERLKSPRARLFVALDLPTPVRERLADWQARECQDPALRRMAPEALHVTLCFLGYRPERAIERIVEVVVEAAGPLQRVPMRLEPDPVPLPRSRPKLYAIGAESEATVELQTELSRALEAARLHEPEKRDFWPHVTVARVRGERRGRGAGGRRGRGGAQRVERPPGPLPESLRAPFGGVRVALYRSILKPQGAEYVSLGGVDLPPAQGEPER